MLGLLAHGLTNADIAARLYLSEGTVRNYVSAIFTKLGVTDRTQAAVLALRHGRMNSDSIQFSALPVGTKYATPYCGDLARPLRS